MGFRYMPGTCIMFQDMLTKEMFEKLYLQQLKTIKMAY